MDNHRTQPSVQASISQDDLLEKLLAASSLEQAGQVEQAAKLYQDIADLDPQGTYGITATKALAAIGLSPLPPLPPIEPETGFPEPPLPQPASPPSERVASSPEAPSRLPASQRINPLRWLQSQWQNYSFATKLTILLVGGTVLPVVIATQSLVLITQNSVQRDFEDKLKADAASWEEEYVLWVRRESRTESENLARLVEVSGANLNDPQQLARQQARLQVFLNNSTAANDVISPEMTKSFRIIANAEGNSVVQRIKIHREAVQAKGTYPPLAQNDRQISSNEFQTLDAKTGIAMGELAIVKTVLQTGKPLKGVELVPAEVLSQLGLAPQAEVALRSADGSTQPAPKGTYNVDDYKAGLASMAVYPIRQNDQVVGVSIVGGLLNRNHALIDYFQQLVQIPSVSIYAYDWRINTTEAAGDQTRAIGTLAPREVSDQVLKQGKDLFRIETIGGVKYFTFYRPLYNFQQETDPAQARPIGMIAVARPKTELDNLLIRQQVAGLAIGGGMLLLVVAVAIPVARAFSGSLRHLAQFAQRFGEGETDARLTETDRQDEIGILSRELNQMSASISQNLADVQQQEQLRRQEADQQRQEKEKLQRSVMNLLLEIEDAKRGDLTVRAPVTEGSIGSIADSFNTTISSLRNLVSQVQVASNDVTTMVQSNTPSMKQLSKEAQFQVEEISRTLLTVGQMGDSINQVATSAEEAATIAQQAAKAAQEGDQMMDATVASINKVRTAVDETANRVEQLTESFKQISQILVTISGISERTNLLAYNASIEASRAGENGQGFRVVAEEVRRLAQRVTDATRSIEQIVETIQQETTSVRQTMEVGTNEVVAGTELVGKTKQTLQGLAEISQRIDQYLQSISQNTQDQAQASQQVNQMMAQVATITQNTSTEIQTMTTSLLALADVARTLQVYVSQFRLDP